MNIDILLGLQWGDEGKGKVVDVLTPHYNTIARFQGGPNAGHTLEFNGIKQVLHTVPSGIFHKSKKNIIGNGMVIDPVIFKKECDSINNNGGNVFTNLFLSNKAHLILPSHRLLDAVYEKAKGNQKIGSTLKGIGPTYTDKVSRNGIRISDIMSSQFNQKYDILKSNHLKIASFYNCNKDEFLIDNLKFSKYEQLWFEGIEFIKKFKLIDCEYFMNSELESNVKVLAEGAQGTLLDVDYGSYPFVTSSNTMCAGAFTGLGVAPSKIGKVYGIFKAYCTRVGSGPFPTELDNGIGEKLRKIGNEFGSTTGRARRCGWLDLPALKYAVMINGVTDLILTKADVLSNFEKIFVCVAYKINGEATEKFPSNIIDLDIEPVYKPLSAWKEISKIRTNTELPDTLNAYINFIEKYVNVPVSIISVGPDREQTIILK